MATAIVEVPCDPFIAVTALQKGVSRKEMLYRKCCIYENTKLRRKEEEISKSTGLIKIQVEHTKLSETRLCVLLIKTSLVESLSWVRGHVT